MGDSIGLLVREEGHIFSPEKNRPLFDENGNVYGCIYGDFCVVGLEKQSFRSLTNKEVILVQRLYETPYNIIIDDAIYVMRTEFFDRSKEKGFDKYNELADHFRRIIAAGNNLRDDITVFMMLHTETVEADGSVIGYKASTVGKLLDKMYNPIESVSINLFSQPKYDDKGKPTFGFYTHPMKVNGIEIPAKSPDGMFEEDFIPNDLQLIVDKMKEYYGG